MAVVSYAVAMVVLWGDWALRDLVGFAGGFIAALTLLEIWQPGAMDGGMFSWQHTTKTRRNWVYNYRVVLLVGGALAFIWAATGR